MTNPCNWMSSIDGNKLISELTIPGTHDSATYMVPQITGAGYVKCQSLSFMEQLKSGCRFLDVRCREFKDDLCCHHGSFYLHLNLNDVLDYCKEFLKNNPSETILMSLKEEYEAKDNTKSYYEAFMGYYNADTSIWYTENEIPRLDDVRGRIVLLRRFPGCNIGIDMSFQDNTTFRYTFNNFQQTLVCEDKYHPDSLCQKKVAVAKNISAAESNRDPNNMFLTFTSGYMEVLYTPKGMAEEMNAWLLKEVKANNYNRSGIFAIDFIDCKLGALLVNNNFQINDGYTLLSSDGGIHNFGNAQYHGHGVGGDRPASGIAITPSGNGYWILSRNGGIHTFGDATYEGHGVEGDNDGIGFAATPSGHGYWILSSNGGIHTYGDASYHGHGHDGDDSATGFACTHSGQGYWILSANGGIHNYGDAEYHGHGINGDDCAVDIVVTKTGGGYWILARNGGIHTFGDATYYGHGCQGNAVKMKCNENGDGYWIFCDNGKVFNYGNAKFLGEGKSGNDDVVSVATFGNPSTGNFQVKFPSRL